MSPVSCSKCEIRARPDPIWIWYRKEFRTKTGKPRALWLCPDCAGDFGSDAQRDAFLKEAYEGRTKPS